MVVIEESFVLMTTNGVKIDNMISKRKKKKLTEKTQ
jgi:hypothetical protein